MPKKQSSLKKFERHHAAILLFLLIAGIFLINIFAFQAAYSRVREDRTQVVSVMIDSTEQAASEDQAEQIIALISRLDGLEIQIEELLEESDVQTAVYVKDLETDESVGVNEKTTFLSASLYKIFASYEIARQIDLGQLNPKQATGFDAGSTPIDECLRRTLAYSDNLCGRALRKLIGAADAPVTSINEAGFVGTSLMTDYPTTSASDVGLFFEKLYRGVELSEEVNQLLLEPLLAQEIDNRLPQSVPESVKIAHKTGDLEGYSHDGGIFYTPYGDYILVVLSGPWPNGYSDAPSQHIAISKVVYDWFKDLNGPTY